MKLQVLREFLQPEETLQSTFLHLWHILKPHVIGHQSAHLSYLFIRKTQTAQDSFGHLDALFDMPVKTNALGNANGVARVMKVLDEHGKLVASGPRQRTLGNRGFCVTQAWTRNSVGTTKASAQTPRNLDEQAVPGVLDSAGIWAGVRAERDGR